jgi:hypothetical protein
LQSFVLALSPVFARQKPKDSVLLQNDGFTLIARSVALVIIVDYGFTGRPYLFPQLLSLPARLPLHSAARRAATI